MPDDKKNSLQPGQVRIEPIFDASGALRRSSMAPARQMEASAPASPLRNRTDHK
ncbi:MAG: hypothetical protein WBN97_00155 [Parvibaculum sp.]